LKFGQQPATTFQIKQSLRKYVCVADAFHRQPAPNSTCSTPEWRVCAPPHVNPACSGRYLYLQNGDNSIFVLCDQLDPLRPGDRSSGWLSGNDDGGTFYCASRFTAAWPPPRTGSGSSPATKTINESLTDFSCARKVCCSILWKKPEESRLIVQAGVVFEAKFDGFCNRRRKNCNPGTSLPHRSVPHSAG